MNLNRRQRLVGSGSRADSDAPPTVGCKEEGCRKCEYVNKDTFFRAIDLINAMYKKEAGEVGSRVCVAGGRARIEQLQPVTVHVFPNVVVLEDGNGEVAFACYKPHASATIRVPNSSVTKALFSQRHDIVSAMCHGFLPQVLEGAYPDGVLLRGTWVDDDDSLPAVFGAPSGSAVRRLQRLRPTTEANAATVAKCLGGTLIPELTTTTAPTVLVRVMTFKGVFRGMFPKGEAAIANVRASLVKALEIDDALQFDLVLGVEVLADNTIVHEPMVLRLKRN